ncbi:DUF896 domain-containing protein [Alkaliphilus hydrothermalis]|uniref:UPF0291 protein JOC73_001360 n=1 Tax=Alkaliphilus hydrothermalis TaxID=1482730 RepID=A0ABS2NPQ0_9FIRM|nr:DUF896 domain-containing protein [Alkaliphilus hydrothermalis]MBM7614841.1 uncharacterized protein YnzC (UPF0291/DUF896 family) [Alkaliphilus hydrothermalis]
MVSKEKIARINELAKISKMRKLTEEEEKERQELRKEYIGAFRKSFKEQLDSIEYVD